VANALLTGERRKRSTEAQATAFLARLTQLPITIDDQIYRCGAVVDDAACTATPALSV
jgi:hypothetical protein